MDKEREQLGQDGYKYIREKEMVISGAPAEVLLNNVISGPATGWSYEFSDESVSGMSAIGIWRRNVKKV